MARQGAIFIVVCMVLIAGSIGAVLFLAFGVSGPEATIVAIGALTALALYNTIATRLRDYSGISEQIATLSRATDQLAERVTELGRQIATIESSAAIASNRARAASVALTAELGELGTLVKQLAESVAAHAAADARPAELEPMPAAPASQDVAMLEQPEVSATANVAPHNDRLLAAIRASLDDNRVDLYLQPIVTLPQRKVRYYEALTRLRSEDGKLLLPADFLAAAESGGLMPKIDLLLVRRSILVVRRLLQKNRDIGLMCNISPATLADARAGHELMQLLEANRELASSLVLELTQAGWRDLDPLEQESAAALAELGFQFSLDHVSDLRLEPRDLAERGVRFLKVPAKLLLEHDPIAFDIHPADLANLFDRFGISVIGERVESESMVVDLIEHGLRLGQGFLFSPPRPVRAEALQEESQDESVQATAKNATKEAAKVAADATAAGARASAEEAQKSAAALLAMIDGDEQVGRRAPLRAAGGGRA